MSRFNPIKIEDTDSDTDDQYGVVEDAAFSLKITKSQATGKQAMSLPAKFLKRFLLPHKPRSVVLVDDEGIESECELLWKNTGENCCHLGKGWYQFVKSHGLKVTDRVVAIPSKDGTILHIFVEISIL